MNAVYQGVNINFSYEKSEIFSLGVTILQCHKL